jgi:nucleotide-binding universal stress UspA family protein
MGAGVLLHAPPAPILRIEAKEDSAMSHKIVVGYDGSAYAHAALQAAIKMARRSADELVVVVGCAPRGMPFDLAGTVMSHRHELEAVCKEELSAAEEECAAQHVPMTAKALYEQPSEAILTIAEQEDAELVVVGSHGEGHFQEGLFGSTVHRLLAHSSVPVVVVPSRGVAERRAQ